MGCLGGLEIAWPSSGGLGLLGLLGLLGFVKLKGLRHTKAMVKLL